MTVERIKRAACIGLENSTITNAIARFATGTPVHLIAADEVHRTMHKYREKHTFLELYQPGDALQATIVCDLLISLATDCTIAANVFEILQKLWPATTAIQHQQQQHQRQQPHQQHLGYMQFLCNAVAALRLQHQHRHSMSMCELLSADALVLEPHALAEWLQREHAFEMLRRLEVSAVDRLDQLGALQPVFKRVRTPAARSQSKMLAAGRSLHKPALAAPVVHLFARAYEFVQNAGRLVRFTSMLPDAHPTPTALLQIDWYEAVGRWVIDAGRKCAPADLEGLLCEMNMNLVHVLAVRLGATAISFQPTLRSRRDSEIDAVNRIIQRLEKHAVATNLPQTTTRKQPTTEPQSAINNLVWSYIGLHNPMLGLLLQRLGGLKGTVDRRNDDCLSRLADLEEVRTTAAVQYANNKWTAALAYDFATVEGVCQTFEQSTDVA